MDDTLDSTLDVVCALPQEGDAGQCQVLRDAQRFDRPFRTTTTSMVLPLETWYLVALKNLELHAVCIVIGVVSSADLERCAGRNDVEIPGTRGNVGNCGQFL